MMRNSFVSLLLISSVFLGSCDGQNASEHMGHSTPIDSTTLNGTQPATYGADNPANVQDTVYKNASDTGTNVSAVPDNVPGNRKTSKGEKY